MMEEIIGRLKERSTWRGIAIILTALGISQSPEMWEAIGLAGASIFGAVEIYFREVKAASVVDSESVTILNNNTTDQNVNAENVNFVETPTQATPELDRIMRENDGA